MKKRKNYNNQFRAKVGLIAIRGEKTLSELAQQYEVHPTLIARRKKLILDNVEQLFEDKRTSQTKKEKEEVQTEELYEQIGRLKMENEWLKKIYTGGD